MFSEVVGSRTVRQIRRQWQRCPQHFSWPKAAMGWAKLCNQMIQRPVARVDVGCLTVCFGKTKGDSRFQEERWTDEQSLSLWSARRKFLGFSQAPDTFCRTTTPAKSKRLHRLSPVIGFRVFSPLAAQSAVQLFCKKPDAWAAICPASWMVWRCLKWYKLFKKDRLFWGRLPHRVESNWAKHRWCDVSGRTPGWMCRNRAHDRLCVMVKRGKLLHVVIFGYWVIVCPGNSDAGLWFWNHSNHFDSISALEIARKIFREHLPGHVPPSSTIRKIPSCFPSVLWASSKSQSSWSLSQDTEHEHRMIVQQTGKILSLIHLVNSCEELSFITARRHQNTCTMVLYVYLSQHS